MPGDLAPPKAGQKSNVFDRLQATPKDNIEGIRTPKRQHSSRFDISDQRQRRQQALRLSCLQDHQTLRRLLRLARPAGRVGENRCWAVHL